MFSLLFLFGDLGQDNPQEKVSLVDPHFQFDFVYPGMVECLIAKTMAWEQERDKPFLYDGVSKHLFGNNSIIKS